MRFTARAFVAAFGRRPVSEMEVSVLPPGLGVGRCQQNAAVTAPPCNRSAPTPRTLSLAKSFYARTVPRAALAPAFALVAGVVSRTADREGGSMRTRRLTTSQRRAASSEEGIASSLHSHDVTFRQREILPAPITHADNLSG